MANDDVDVHEYTIIGNGIVEHLVGKPFFQFPSNAETGRRLLQLNQALKLPKIEPLTQLYYFNGFYLFQVLEIILWN